MKSESYREKKSNYKQNSYQLFRITETSHSQEDQETSFSMLMIDIQIPEWGNGQAEFDKTVYVGEREFAYWSQNPIEYRFWVWEELVDMIEAS